MMIAMLETLPLELRELLAEEPVLQRAFLVGGCVRDHLLGESNKDFDIEVYGVSFETLERALRRHGRTDLVGRSFGVIKFTGADGSVWDFSIPRRDSKTGAGHKGFTVEFDARIEPAEAAARRDFTINALMYDPRRNEVLDFFGGRRDLEQGTLRHTSPAFAEDPLRVLRGMQLAGRFDLTAAPETLTLCRSISGSYPELAVERVRDEWFKWAAKSRRPSAGLCFLRDSDWLRHFPEIAALDGTPQDPEWHPEGDVFVHTCHCCDAMAELPEWHALTETGRVVAMLGILCHDLAKPETTHRAIKDGRERIVSPGHEQHGGPLTEEFLNRIRCPNAIRNRVVPLVTNHLAHLQTINSRSVRRLANRLAPATIEELCLVMIADQHGRPPKPRTIHAGVERLRAAAEELRLRNAAPKPILLGRHLIAAGRQPGREFGELLKEAFEAQLEGAFDSEEGALLWLRSRLDPPEPT